MARRAAAALSAGGRAAAIAPTIAYARADFAAGFAGTLSLSPSAFETHLEGVLASLFRGGFARVCLVNAHIDPAHLDSLRAVARRAEKKVALPDMTERAWRHRLRDEAQGIDGHAGAFETALVLAARPDAVRAAIAQALPAVAANLGEAIRAGARTFEEAGGKEAYFGQPARATREMGESIYGILVEMILAACAETFPPAQ
jgi:creatinine amidohydrolase